MLWMHRKIIALAVMALTGCETMAPNQYELRFQSVPSGAMVYSARGTPIGITPVEKIAVLSPAEMAREPLTDEVILVWPSGATSRQTMSIWPHRAKIWTLTFQRPANAPGLDVDLRNAALQQFRGGSDGGLAEMLAGFAAAYTAGRYSGSVPTYFVPPTHVRCNTRNAGWAVVTDCRQQY